MTAVTLDTNVLGSGLVGIRVPTSTPGEILRRWRAGDFTLLLSDHILGELEDLLADPYFADRLSRAERAAALQLFRTEALITPLTVPVQGVATHPEDDLVLATALSGKAAYLVTGDTKLQRLGAYQGVTILSPRAFLDHLLSSEEATES